MIEELATRLGAVLDRLDGDAEVVLVDDGSTDATFERMLGIAQADPCFRVVKLSRNFGHQTALTAGVDYASGDAVVILDADLQDPPEVILELARAGVTTFIGRIQLIVLGVIGEYIGDIHVEVKRRPLYVVSELENFPDQPEPPSRAVVAERRASERVLDR